MRFRKGRIQPLEITISVPENMLAQCGLYLLVANLNWPRQLAQNTWNPKLSGTYAQIGCSVRDHVK